MGAIIERQQAPAWIESLHAYVRPYWDEILNGDFAEGVARTALTVPEMQGWMLQMYPFIHAFPKFLAEALIKVEDDTSRAFLIDNIRLEKTHAEHWLWMGQGFGLEREDMIGLAEGDRPLLRDVQSLTDWLWYVNTKGSLAEAVGATSFAIEGITGDLCKKYGEGFMAYCGKPGVEMTPRTYKWVREHAKYDDDHPKHALVIVARYASSERLQRRVMLAAKRSLQLLHQALLTCYRAYAPDEVRAPHVEAELRVTERRKGQESIRFPDRRFRDRRGRGRSDRVVL